MSCCRPDLARISLDYSLYKMAGSQAPYIHVILSYIVSIVWYINQPLVSDTTVHYQSTVSMISFAQTWTAQWSDIIPSQNIQLLVRIHLTWLWFHFNRLRSRHLGVHPCSSLAMYIPWLLLLGMLQCPQYSIPCSYAGHSQLFPSILRNFPYMWYLFIIQPSLSTFTYSFHSNYLDIWCPQ